MIDINAVYSSDAFSLVTGPSSAIARASSIAEYRRQPMAFHHIVGAVRRAPARRATFRHLRTPQGARTLADATKTLNVPYPRQVPD
ncbi:MAG TPA: hypothetical protein VHN17_10625 [Steroidobacteraceae bacterium]|jgi:hypothetical protein|nr:hypothetical protein [Steroidobacteraceae bacterium]